MSKDWQVTSAGMIVRPPGMHTQAGRLQCQSWLLFESILDVERMNPIEKASLVSAARAIFNAASQIETE